MLGRGTGFTFVWSTDKGGNGKTYNNCYFDNDSFKRSIIEMGYGDQMQLEFWTIDTNTYTPPDNFDFYYKAKYDIETQFNTLVDKAITYQNNRRSLWSTPKKRWILKFEKNRENRELIEAFFIAKRGKFKSFDLR